MKLRNTLLASAIIITTGIISNIASAQVQQCQACGVGTYSNSTTNNECRECEAGFYCIGGSDRRQCDPGFIQPNKGRSSCIQCLGGQTANAGRTACQCPFNNFWNTTHNSCTNCNQLGATGWTSPAGSTVLSQCTFNFSQRTVASAYNAIRLDGLRAWNLPGVSHGTNMGNNVHRLEFGHNAGRNRMQAGCFSTGGNTKVSASTPNGGGYCYCRAADINGNWSSWGLAIAYHNLNANTCRTNCAADCGHTDSHYVYTSWGLRASWPWL